MTLTVNALNDAPVAVDDTYQMSPDTTLVINVASGILANDTDADSDALQPELMINVSNGALNLNTDGSFDYTPNPGFSGTENFTYQAVDSQWDYQVAVNVDANGFARFNKPVVLDVLLP